MMHDKALRRARIVSSVAATVISLACGTNYVYSAWAPQFADRLRLSATESNLIGLAGNLGMYSMGVPIGMVIDHKGPRPAVIVGSLLLGFGYFPIKQAFDAGAGSVGLLCVFSYLTGLGGCMAFASAVKTSALNWPHHRGTATAFPLAAFGLSAFFFSVFGGLLFPGNTSDFLMMLAVGTFVLTFVGFFFLRVLPHTSYQAVPGEEGSQPQQRLLSGDEAKAALRAGRGKIVVEPGMSSPSSTNHYENNGSAAAGANAAASVPAGQVEVPQPSGGAGGGGGGDTSAAATRPDAQPPPALSEEPEELDETSSLMSRTSSLPGDVLVQSSVDMDRSHRVDIRGWKLLRNVEFWQQFSIMGLLAGIGLMTINNIGHDANALWKHYDDSVDDNFLINRQQMHVSILSLGSFSGRLLSGVGSDFLVKRLHASRVWCLVIASVIFCVAQVCALQITNPHFLGLVSGFSGLGYGFLFGVFPSIVAETFGVHGLSQNWGFMTLSPVISGNIFNLFYGAIFDRHSIIAPDGERSCPDGLECYRSAYFVTLGACGLGVLVTLLVIRHERLQRLKEEKGRRDAED